MRLLGLALLASVAVPAHAQDHAQHTDHSAHQPQEEQPVELPEGFAEALFGADEEDDPHAGHNIGPDKTAGLPSGPPPAEAFEGPEHAADAIFGEERMAEAREDSRRKHGGQRTGMVLVERLEARLSGEHDAFLWDAQGWYGGDIDKFVIKTEGEGEFGGSVEDAELQFLWSHAIGPWWDLQAGARLDVEPETRSHLVLGVQGLAPYMFHVDASAFLSDRGDLTARIEGEHDWKLTQSLILQPRAEIVLSAQDIPEREVGAGLVKLETGLRLRYEFVPEFGPYIGVGYEAKLGKTADLARAAGEDVDGLSFLVGLRAWF